MAGGRGLGGALAVGVLDAQQHRAVGVLRIQPVEQRRARAADVQIAGGRGGKAGDDLVGHGTLGKRRKQRVWLRGLSRVARSCSIGGLGRKGQTRWLDEAGARRRARARRAASANASLFADVPVRRAGAGCCSPAPQPGIEPLQPGMSPCRCRSPRSHRSVRSAQAAPPFAWPAVRRSIAAAAGTELDRGMGFLLVPVFLAGGVDRLFLAGDGARLCPGPSPSCC